jgi:hypothetical protein
VRDEHWRAFGRDWFAQHQSTLLGLLARPWIGRWLRWVLRIRASDVGFRKPIRALYPHAYTVDNGDGTYSTDIRTHDKFAKRLYFAFRPFWWLGHAWDWLIADRWVSQLSFGLSILTLTSYPEAGAVGTLTSDRTVRRIPAAGESFSTLRNGIGTHSANSSPTAGVGLFSDLTTDIFLEMYREIQAFNFTSMGITPNVSAIVSIYGVSKVNTGLGTPDFHFAGATPADPASIVTADYTQVQRVSFGSVTYAAFTASAYNDVSLNASGIAAIQLNGVASFSWQLEWDITGSFTGTWVSNTNTTFNFSTADAAGTAQDPKLTVTYIVPTAGPSIAWKKRRAAFAVSNPGSYF